MGTYIKTGVAALLVAMLLVLGGLGVAGVAESGGGLASFLPRTEAAQSGPQAREAVQIRAADEATNAEAAANRQAPATQSGGVTDARTAVKRTGPAVVTVINKMAQNVTGNSRRGGNIPGLQPEASGSGVIIDNRGYILTNNHVVDGQQSLEVIFSDGKKATAKLVGTDAFSDLAVIKVDVAVPATAQFGDSSALEPGQPVVAIGSALGDFENTVTVGVVSGLNRDIDASANSGLRDLIQTDAAINHGNSGGPLLDLEGRVIGINVAVVRGGNFGDVAEGLGFAIPSNTAREVTDQLIKNGQVQRPYVGIEYQSITPQTAAYYGLNRDNGILVRSVSAGSPSEKAGITTDSIITKFDGVELNSDNSLLELLLKHKPGDSVQVSYLPDGATTEKEVTLVLATRPKDK